MISNKTLRLRWILMLGLLSVFTVGGYAQDLTGDWFYRGFYAKARGGLQKGYDQNFDVGNFNFVSTGGDNYRVTIVDQNETEMFDLNLVRNGDTFFGDGADGS